LISQLRRVVNVVFFLLGDSQASCEQDLWRWNRQRVPKRRNI